MPPTIQPVQAPQPIAPANPTYQAVIKSARKTGDVIVLIVTILISGVLMFLLFEGTAIQIFITAVLAIIISLVYVRLSQVAFLGNAFRVQNGRHAYLLQIVQEISTNLQMPTVDVYITQDPYLNAFAVGYARPFTIVLHSATVEELTSEELRAVLIHEMGHIKYRHTIISAYIQPLSVLVPVLGSAVGWLFGFWGRRAEMACDRLALAYTRDPHTVINALVKIHVGSKFAVYISEEGISYQEQLGGTVAKRMSESLQTHPFLTTRLHEMHWFSQKLGLTPPTATPTQQTATATTQS